MLTLFYPHLTVFPFFDTHSYSLSLYRLSVYMSAKVCIQLHLLSSMPLSFCLSRSMFKLHFYVHILSHNPTLCVGFFLVHTYSRLLSLSLSLSLFLSHGRKLQIITNISQDLFHSEGDLWRKRYQTLRIYEGASSSKHPKEEKSFFKLAMLQTASR